MDLYSAIQYVLFVAIVTALVKPLGEYMERVFSRKRTLLDRFFLPVERLIYRITAVDPDNANGAHPYENPTPLTTFLEMLAIVLLPAALTNTFGRMVGQPRQGWLLYGVMLLLFLCGLVFVHHSEQRGFSHIGDLGSSRRQSGGNMEGKEVRFGIGGSTLTAVVTSNTATGSNNSTDDSYTSLGGMVLLVNMLLGELVFGGLGTGLYSMVMAAAVAVFLAGLMVGRTP